MPSPSKPSSATRGRRLRAWLLRAAIAVVVLALLALGAYATRDRWTPAALAFGIRRAAGLEASIGSARWTGLSRLEVEQLSVTDPDARTPLELLRADRVAVELDLARVWREGLAGIASIEAGHVELEIDTTRTAAGPPSSASEPPDLAAIAKRLPRVAIEDADVGVRFAPLRAARARGARLSLGRSGDVSLARSGDVSLARSGDVSLARSGDALEIALAARSIEYEENGRTIAHPFDARARWDGRVLEIVELALDPGFTHRGAKLDLSRLAEGRASASIDLDAFEGSASITATLSDRLLDARARVRGVRADRVLEWFTLPRTFDATVDFDLAVGLTLGEPERATAGLSLDLFEVKVADRTIDWVRVVAALDQSTIRASEVYAAQGPNTLVLQDVSLPRDRIDLCGVREAGEARFEVVLRDLPTLFPTPETLPHPPHSIELAGVFARGALELERGEIEIADADVTLRRGHVPLDASFQAAWLDPRLDVDLSLSVRDLGRTAALFGASDWRGSATAAVRARGSAKGPRGFADVQARDLVLAGRELGRLAGHCEIDPTAVDVTHVEIDGRDASLDARGRYSLADQRFESATLRAHVRDLGEVAAGWPTGMAEVEAEWRGPLGALEGTLAARGESIEWGRQQISSAEVRARFDASSSDVFLRAAARDFGDVRALVRVDGAPTEIARTRTACALVRDLQWSDGERNLALFAPFEIVVAPDEVACTDLALGGSAGSLTASFVSVPGAGELACAMHTLQITPWLARFIDPGARSGPLDVDARMRWSPDDLALELTGTVDHLSFHSAMPEIAVAAAVNVVDRRVTIHDTSVRTADGSYVVIDGELPLDLRAGDWMPEGPLRVSGRLEVPDAREALRTVTALESGSLRSEFQLTGSWSEPQGVLAVHAENLAGAPGSPLERAGLESMDIELALDERITIRQGDVDLGHETRMSISGWVGGALDLRELARGRLELLSGAPLDVRVDVAARDLSRLSVLFPDLRRLGGTLDAGITIDGDLGAPRLSGSLVLTEGELRLATSMPSLTGVEIRLALDGDTVTVERVAGEMGGAPFEVSGKISGYGGDDTEMSLKVTGESLLLARSSGLILRADADLMVEGSLDAPSVSGELALVDSKFTHDFDLLSMGRSGSSSSSRGEPLFRLDPPFDRLEFHVRARAKKPFLVQTNMYRGTLRPELELLGTGEIPVLRGTIYAETGRVTLPTGTTRLRSGRVDFDPSDPFVPRIEAIGELRMRGYDITIRVSGSVAEPIVELTSVPPLSREDLILLVLTDRPPGEELSIRTGQRAAQEVAIHIARDVVADWMRSRSDSSNDQVDETVELETDQDKTHFGGQDTVRARVRLLEGKLGKRAGVYVTGERDAFDHYNYGLRFLLRFQ